MREIHIFDLDDTLTHTPSFVDLLQIEDQAVILPERTEFAGYLHGVRKAFYEKHGRRVHFRRSGDFVLACDDLHVPYSAGLASVFTEKRYAKMFDERDGLLVVKPHAGFHRDPRTIGRTINEEVHAIYTSVQNSMILTGRDEALRGELESVFTTIGLAMPTHGLRLYSGNIGVKQFKTNTIIASIREHGWETVHFYEDRKDWLGYAEKCVLDAAPGVAFVSHLITNVHDMRSL